MKTFSYKGLNRDGRACKGLVEALTPKEARERLSVQGVLAERVTQVGGHAHFNATQRSETYRELAALLSAGLPLLRALEVLIESPEADRMRPLLASVRDAVRDGLSLSCALSDASSEVSEFEVAIIDAAERSGSIESMLESLAEFIEESEHLKERVQNTLIYPAIVFTVGICIALVMLGILLPRAQDLLVGSAAPLPWITRAMIVFGRWVFRILPLVLVGGLLTGVHVWRRRDDAAFKKRVARRVFDVPMLGKGRRILVNLRFARTMGSLLQGGVPVIEGFMLAGRATGNAWIAELTEAQAEKMRHGDKLSDALRSIPPLSGSLPGWCQVGEASGGLIAVMNSASRRFSAHWDRYVTRTIALLEPLLILLIGGFVLLVTLSVLLPVIAMSRAVGN